MPSRSPRVNVCVTDEQHALLLELGALQGRSAASYLREMLDSATPIIRSILPALRLASQQMEATREEAEAVLKEPLQKLKALGMLGQLELLDHQQPKGAAPGALAASGSKRGRAKSSAARHG